MTTNADTKAIHERAERSSSAAQNSILSLSSGGVGLLSLMLTNGVQPSLNQIEKIDVMVGAGAFGVCVLASITRMTADAQRHYCLARAQEAKEKSVKEKYYLRSQRHHRINRRMASLQPILFGIGIAAVTLYTALRAL